MYCEIVYFMEENKCKGKVADLKPRGYNCFWNDSTTLNYSHTHIDTQIHTHIHVDKQRHIEDRHIDPEHVHTRINTNTD